MILSFDASKYIYATWYIYHSDYLIWMIKVDHPDLKKSNYNADKFLENFS